MVRKLKSILWENDMSITCEYVRDLFDYRCDGKLIRKVHRSPNAKVGDVAGTHKKKKGNQIKIGEKLYQTHRLIWLWHHGYMPEGCLDHRNRNNLDNRIENLREVSHQCNLRNTGNHKDNKTGVKGVSWEKQKRRWQVRIGLNDKYKNLGSFKYFYEAVLHRLAAEQCLNWDGCDSSSPAYRYAINNGLIKPSP